MTTERMSHSNTGPVLLDYDGSDGADRAVRVAGALLSSTRAAVVHVREGLLGAGLSEAGRRVALEAGFHDVAVVDPGRGRVASGLLDQARAHGASVIVGDVPGALLNESDVPVLAVGPRAPRSPATEPIFVGYDGSPIARDAIAAAAELLAGRVAIVASFMPPVDDLVVLRSSLPWPAGGELQDRLARLDRQEAEAPAMRAEEGARVASAAGFAARPVGITGADASDEEQEEPWRRLLRAAADEAAACIVVGHRASADAPVSTAHALVNHADRPVLVVPQSFTG